MINIILYTRTSCAFSKRFKAYLLEQRLPFEERNIDTMQEWRDELVTYTDKLETPVCIADNSYWKLIIKGYTEKSIKVLKTALDKISSS